MRFAINFLKSNAGIESPALLSSPAILLTLAYFGRKLDYKIGNTDEETIRRWVLIANAKGRYSRGSSETILDQDLTIIRNGGKGAELIDRLRQQVGRLDVAADELVGRNQRSALFKTMFLAFRAKGAKDWRSNLTIALDHSGAQHQLQFHHIFPKRQLKNIHTAREADDIANLAFIGGKTNRSISDKPPVQYLIPLIEQHGTSSFDAQAIPTNVKLLKITAYQEFLAARRKEIVKQLNEFLMAE